MNGPAISRSVSTHPGSTAPAATRADARYSAFNAGDPTMPTAVPSNAVSTLTVCTSLAGSRRAQLGGWPVRRS